MKVIELNKDLEENYSQALLSQPDTLLYASLRYRNLLKDLLRAEDHYLVAVERDQIFGALPLFIKRNSEFGDVSNSLPFYGSNGGAIVFSGGLETKSALLLRFSGMMLEEKCVASTIISSPFETNWNIYNDFLHPLFIDERIGQVSYFPKEIRADTLLNSLHKKTRNLIKKAVKSDIKTSVEDNFDFIYKTHKDNLKALGGISKPKEFFDLIPRHFDCNGDYRIYTALLNDIPIAALFLFYYNNTVEYFTPAISKDYRILQPLSLLIYTAMQDAIRSNFTFWNWGGTWPTNQDGVYHFKNRWGASDCRYYYFTNVYDESILDLPKETILEEYPYFYVVPFNRGGST